MAAVTELGVFVACFLYLVVQGATEYKRPSDASYVLDIPSDFHQRVKEPDDFIKLTEWPTSAAPEFDVAVSFRCRDARLITFEVLTIRINGRERVEHSSEIYISAQTEKTETVKFHVKLRDSLVFLENKVLRVHPDLHTQQVLLYVTLTDLDLPAITDDEVYTVLKSDHQRILLKPPWSRPRKPGFCFPWIWQHLLANEERKISKCHALNGEFNIDLSSSKVLKLPQLLVNV